ncbi:hypothetical protein NECAME_14785 [Necator americanus]|uniref:Uncharacterized protein n=1 Tax=Necator americanus TaxID=51031 RepID=W2SL69_NECAM|nr:hypothetical protein NECAME_14785 [Necator americanus]ETN70414.1 hypothetical protein NECAME_14785 [Necator americanus]
MGIDDDEEERERKKKTNCNQFTSSYYTDLTFEKHMKTMKEATVPFLGTFIISPYPKRGPEEILQFRSWQAKFLFFYGSIICRTVQFHKIYASKRKKEKKKNGPKLLKKPKKATIRMKEHSKKSTIESKTARSTKIANMCSLWTRTAAGEFAVDAFAVG